MWAVIGGSGFENFEEFESLEDYKIETPYGNHSSTLKRVRWNGVEMLFLSRHGKKHELKPSDINYRANIYALKKLGATGILSFSAVGSLKEEIAPLDLVLVDQYIDFTKKRESTFLQEGQVGHYAFSQPVSTELVNKVDALLDIKNLKVHKAKTYVCVEGPRFSSKAESLMFIKWGADIIGMTNMPESYLALEAGLLYLPFCFVTDYDCWKEEEDPVTLQIVLNRLKKNQEKSKEILNSLVPRELYLEFKVPNINQSIMSGPPVAWLEA